MMRLLLFYYTFSLVFDVHACGNYHGPVTIVPFSEVNQRPIALKDSFFLRRPQLQVAIASILIAIIYVKRYGLLWDQRFGELLYDPN